MSELKEAAVVAYREKLDAMIALEHAMIDTRQFWVAEAAHSTANTKLHLAEFAIRKTIHDAQKAK